MCRARLFLESYDGSTERVLDAFDHEGGAEENLTRGETDISMDL